MNKFFLCIILMIQLSGCSLHSCQSKSTSSLNSITLNYSGYKFYIPSEPFAILKPTNENDNSLIFTYSSDKISNYLGFDEIPDDEFTDSSCSQNIFLADAFNNNNKSICNQEKLRAFKEIFFIYPNAKKGSFVKGEVVIYFSIGQDRSFLFICKENRKIVQIGSNFLSEQELKNITGDI